MDALVIIFACIYTGALIFFLLYSLIQAGLVVNYLRHRKKKYAEQRTANPADRSLPHVTVQLPVFNEKYVVERLIDAVAAFDYPRDKLEIQVLDDSTDESAQIASCKVGEISATGIDIKHIHRTNREGFKAGALAHGLALAQGEFVAVFDADFVPNPDFLIQTVPCFSDPQVGMVQTRWEHLNEDYSLLTKLQAFGLNAHFSVEQGGRNYADHFMNFNGTAGIWRKTCIENAGGWSSDTLSEDLDLSYRAQVKGWRFKYLENVCSPAELPAVMNALKTQQFRWTKGAAECTRKNMGRIFRTRNIGIMTKLHALFHLMNSFLFLCIITTSVLSVPAVILRNYFVAFNGLFKYYSFFLVSLCLLSVFYWVSFGKDFQNKPRALGIFLFKFPLFLSVSMGLSLHNAIAVFEGYIGKKSPFIRTPKFNIVRNSDQWTTNKYLSSDLRPLTIFEGLFTLYFGLGLGLAVYFGDYGFLPFHLMLTIGFGLVFYYSLNHARTVSKQKAKISARQL